MPPSPLPAAPAPRLLDGPGQLFWLLNQRRPIHFAVYAQIEGRTAVAAWRNALDAMQRRHPNLAACIVPDADGTAWLQPENVPIPMRVVPGDGLSWTGEMERELATGFEAGQAPLARAVLLHHAQRATLILAAHHAVADGRSLVFAVRDTFHALAGVPPAPPPPVASLDTWFAARPAVPEGAPAQDGLAPEPGRFAYRTGGPAVPRVSSYVFSPEATGRLRQRCRSEGATVQCALVAAAAETVRQLRGTPPAAALRVSSPIDFRAVIGAADEVAPLGAGVMVPMGPHATLWDAARFARTVIEPARTEAALAAAMGQMGPFLAGRPGSDEVAGFWVERLGYDVNVSNLGEVPIEARCGGLRLAALGGPAILSGFAGEQEIGVATVGGALHLLHASYEPLPALLPLMAQRLAAA